MLTWKESPTTIKYNKPNISKNIIYILSFNKCRMRENNDVENKIFMNIYLAVYSKRPRFINCLLLLNNFVRNFQ